MNRPTPNAAGPARGRTWLLWILALLVMAGTAFLQRRTGPTHPLRCRVELDGEARTFRLVRSGDSREDAVVRLDAGDLQLEAALVYRRYPTAEPFTRTPFARRPDGALEAPLPRQPAAGKLAYHVDLQGPAGPVRLPREGEAILRFKDPVSPALLLPHIAFMFLAVLLGIRTGLGALAGEDRNRLALWALGFMTLGGLFLGPLVQKAAFGHYWTGFPWGQDLTDNKTLLMWLIWALACFLAPRLRPAARRWTLGLAALAMLAVYCVPHSLRGSQLDYGRLGQGTDPRGAVVTGR